MTKKTLLSIILIMTMVFTATVSFDAATRPSKVQRVYTVKATTNSISLKWGKASHAKYYQVFMITKTYKSHGKTKYKYKKGKTTKKTNCTIKKLKAGKTYKFRIRAVNKKKKGKLSTIKKVRTKSAIKASKKTAVQKVTKYRVVFKYKVQGDYSPETGNTVKSESVTRYVKKGGNAVPPRIDKEYTDRDGNLHVFVKWDSSYKNIQKNKTINAVYKVNNSFVYEDYKCFTKDELQSLSKKDFAAINSERRKNNIAQLSWDDELASIAMKRAEECAKLGRTDHYSPTSGDPTDALRYYNYKNCQQYVSWDEKYGVETFTGPMPTAGENMIFGCGFTNEMSLDDIANSIHDSYMNSSGHKTMLLSKSCISVGVATCFDKNNYKIYNVELFLLK